LLQALPDTEKEINARLAHLRTEVAPLLLQKEKIDNHAHRWGWLRVGSAGSPATTPKQCSIPCKEWLSLSLDVFKST